MLKVGEANMRLKELEVALELSELNKQHAEKESALVKENAEHLLSEVKHLEQMVNITLSFFSCPQVCIYGLCFT